MNEPAAVEKAPEEITKQQTVASTLHSVVLLVIVAGWIYLSWKNAAHLRTVENLSRVRLYTRGILWDWMLVGYIALGLHFHGGSLRALMGGKWNSAISFFKDIGIAALFWIAAIPILSIIRLIVRPAKDLNSINFLLPEGATEIFLWVLVAITAGICEEILFRGYLQKQFTAWMGNAPLAIALSAIIFGSAHIYQGARQVVVLGVYGALFGILAWKIKSIRPGIMAHAWQDTFAGLLGALAKHLKLM